jgi:hypothetical protein
VLAGGASTAVTVSVNSIANALSAGSFDDTISFSNETNNNGNTTRNAGLTVNPIPVAVTLGNLNQTYNGGPRPVTVTTNPTPKAYSVTYEGQTTEPVNAGNYAVVATVTEPNHQGSTSGTLVVAKATQAITFGALTDVQLTTGSLALDTTSSSGLPVSYTSSNSAVATVSGNTVTLLSPGTTTLTASQEGDTNYEAAATVPQVLTVIGPVDGFTISGISSPQVVGTPVTGMTLTALDAAGQTATSYTGTVTFGGTGGFAGTSASFTDGILTGASATPTAAGSDLTLTVDDGAGHVGSVTITTILSAYAAWAGVEDFEVDANGDGVKDGLAWLLGADNPAQNAASRLPTILENGGTLTLSFRCMNAARRAGATLHLEHSAALGLSGPWSSILVPDASGDSGGINFVVTPDGDFNQVSATVPAGEADAGRLFARLRAQAAP